MLKNYKFNFQTKTCSFYEDYLDELQVCTKNVLENPDNIYCLFYSHQPVFTYGSGLEKQAGKVKDGLIDFDLSNQSQLAYPLYVIKRGGGITFHHQGQLNIYPIFSITYSKKNLQTFMLRNLKFLSEYFNNFFKTQDFHYKGKFLGLWYKDSKVGSIGMGLHRYISRHGIALNLEPHRASTKGALLCGLNNDIYTDFKTLGFRVDKEDLINAYSNYLEETFS